MDFATCLRGFPMMVEPGWRSGPSPEVSRYSNTVTPGLHSYATDGGTNAANPNNINVVHNVSLIRPSSSSPSPRLVPDMGTPVWVNPVHIPG